MALGATLDAGADIDELRKVLERLPLGGWGLEAEPVLRNGIAATKAHVTVTETGVVRSFSDILGLLEEARLPPRIRDRSIAAFTALAVVEGRLHRQPPARVHFHEVGGHDAIIDIVGTMTGLELLGVDEVYASAIALGTGMVRTDHGLLPKPAPAVLGLLEGIPTLGLNLDVELTTPTGAAILQSIALGYGPLPAMRLQAAGYGAGSAEFESLPNCCQLVVGLAGPETQESSLGPGQPVMLLETNIDDATGETLAHTVATLLDAGAHDAWLTPVLMKKGRPGSVVSLLCDLGRADELRRILEAETATLGVRGTTLSRWPARRHFDEVDVAGNRVRLKIGPGTVKVEHDDAAVAATHSGLPLREVAAAAESAWRESHRHEPGL